MLSLVKHNAERIYVSGRNQKSAEAVIKQAREAGSPTKLTFLPADLADLASVKAAADKVLAQEQRLDLLIANAGIMAKPPGLTQDGYELHFGTNHLGHALLIRKLLPLLQRTAAQGWDTRVIILTSVAFRMSPRGGGRGGAGGGGGGEEGGIIFRELRTPMARTVLGSWLRYGQSKLANLVYAKELARRYPDITTVSVHPGVVPTDLIDTLPATKRWFVYLTTAGIRRKPEEGDWSQLWCVAAPKAELHAHNGDLYEPVGVHSTMKTKWSEDRDLATKLWDYTEEQLTPFLG